MNGYEANLKWLNPSNTLGTYPDREEFQVDRVIVWVEIPSYGSRATWLKRADRSFEGLWRTIPAVALVAEQESRALIPVDWKAHDEAGQTLERLSVWASGLIRPVARQTMRLVATTTSSAKIRFTSRSCPSATSSGSLTIPTLGCWFAGRGPALATLNA